jgi:hypothetical protein
LIHFRCALEESSTIFALFHHPDTTVAVLLREPNDRVMVDLPGFRH